MAERHRRGGYAVSAPLGRFIVLEGGDGSGKTTLALGLAEALRERGVDVLVTEEPSRGPVGVLLRQLLHAGPLSPEAMALLYAADRAHHADAVLLPALARGTVILCTRYLLSSLAYQGPHLGMERVLTLNATALTPDLLLFLSCAPTLGLERAGASRLPDAFETEEVAARAERGYLAGLAYLRSMGQRVVQVDGTQPPATVLRAALEQVLPVLGRSA